MALNIRSNKSSILGTVIAVDPLSETIRFCTPSDDGSSLQTSGATYRPRAFDKEFYDRLAKSVRQQTEKNPDMDLQRTSLILPDRLFLLDMVSVPSIHRKAMQHSLSLAIQAIYKNADELSLMTYAVRQTKQSSTYGLVGIRRDLTEQVRATLGECGVNVTGITFASNATVNGAMALNSKLRSESFLLLDIKESYSRFAFVVRGCTMGYYDLPFGYGMLYKSRVASEDLLFDHRAGELLVLNAKERARAKQLTLEGTFAAEETSIHETPEGEGEVYEAAPDARGRSARKLPKFMQRPIPQSGDEYLYENFRIILKWTLDLISGNREITSLASINTVYVNMPEEYGLLFDMIKGDREEHGVTFAPLLTEKTDSSVTENLDLYGGFFLNRFNGANTF